MKPTTVMYIGAGILFLIGLCLVGYGVLSVIGSTSSQGSSSWLGFGIGFAIVGILFLAGGAGLVIAAMRGTKTEVVQQVTMKVDLPGETKIEAMKCRSCGGELTADNIKLVNGAPMVTCPYCNTIYQLTEEPKW
jgi:ABC-type transport system involved in multi-copper enzyme maturation permease subunit